MKKILLSLFALIAMVGMVNAQRAWAYDLGLGYESDTYTFTFKATTAANATLIFTDAEGVELATHDAGAVVAGSNTIALTKAQLPEGTEIHWAVKMTGAAIALSGSYLTELTAAGQGLDFYLPQGVVVDNNPESETFSTLFIAEAQGGKLSVGPTHKQGIYHYSQTLTELNPTDQGIIPSNVTLTNGSRQEMHRIAINPKNNHVAFAHNVSGKAAVWSVHANNPAGEATNLIAGTSITMPNSICFDENGVLYVMDNANATTGGTLYKVVDGVATKLVQNKTWQQVDNSLAYDGRGGIWIAQTSASNTWPSYAILSHVNSKGEIDWSALDHGSDGLFSAGNGYGYSQRGQCAYNAKEDLLVLGGNCRSHIFQVTYDVNTGVPSVSLKYRTPFIKASTNIDGAAFDYAGDLYLMSAARERLYKYVVPTDNNTCITPAPKAQVIINSDDIVLYTITATPNNETMGTVSGAGTYVKGTEVTLTASPKTGHEFVNWSNGSTNNPMVFTATEDVELTANFKALQYTVTVGVNDETKGSVTNAGEHTLDYGTELVLTATPAEGYRFAKWSNGATANPLTTTVTGDAEIIAQFELTPVRAWAYDLEMDVEDKAYTFTFKATTIANATLVFTNAEGAETGTVDLGTVAVGVNTKTLAADEIPGEGEIHWAVKLAGEAIENIAETTDQSRGIYDFYNMMDVLVDNNPESNYFGEIYVQMALAGTTNGKAQTPGLFIFNQELNLLNESPNAGIQPTLPDGYTMGGERYKFHRLDIDPKTGNLTYCYNISNKPAVFAMDRANLTGEVTNLVAGIDGFLRTSAHCFDADGTLYVYDYDARVSGSEKAIIYKIKDGVKTQLTEATTKFVQHSVTLASDGKDGLWVGQNRGAMDGYYQLVHVTAAGELDYIVNSSNTHGFTGGSSRGALAYDAERHILAQGRDGAVELFSVTYNAETSVPTLTKFATTPYVGYNIDGLHFDYAGDLYVVNSSNEKFQKFAVPTNNNTCTTPAPKALVITKPSNPTAIDNTILAPQVEKIVRDGQVLIIRDGKTFNMMGQEVK